MFSVSSNYAFMCTAAESGSLGERSPEANIGWRCRYVTMKKRYLVKRYALPAIVVLFLLIWLSQQNATDNSILDSILVDQQPALYDPAERLVKDSQSLEQGKHVKTRRNPIRQISSRNHTSFDAQILTDTVIEERDWPKPQHVLDENHSEDSAVHKERARNYHVDVSNEDTQLPPDRPPNDALELKELDSVHEGRSQNYHVDRSNKDTQNMPTDEVLELEEIDSQRDTDVKSLLHRNTRDFMKDGLKSVTVANSEIDRELIRPTRFPINMSAEYRRTRPFRQLVFNHSALSSHAESRNVSETNSQDNSFNVTVPSIKPLTSGRRVSSDDDADDSLILAREMALKNFVRTDEEHPPADQPENDVGSKVSDILSVKSNQQDQYKRVFENMVENTSVDRRRKQEIDELEKFAKVPTLPEYDLPLLKKKTADDRVAPTSTVLPALVRGGIPAVSHLVGNKTVDGASGLKLEDDEVLADTDDVMSSAVVFGEVNPNRTYAVFSTTTENRDALNFVFLLPLTALAWKRVGFDSIVIIVGRVDVWNSNELSHFVLSAVRQLDAVVVFLEPRPEKSVMISQVEM